MKKRMYVVVTDGGVVDGVFNIPEGVEVVVITYDDTVDPPFGCVLPQGEGYPPANAYVDRFVHENNGDICDEVQQAVSEFLDKKKKAKLRIRDLTELQWEYLANKHPDWVAEVRPHWMARHHTNWMARHMTKWMCLYRPMFMQTDHSNLYDDCVKQMDAAFIPDELAEALQNKE